MWNQALLSQKKSFQENISHQAFLSDCTYIGSMLFSRLGGGNIITTKYGQQGGSDAHKWEHVAGYRILEVTSFHECVMYSETWK